MADLDRVPGQPADPAGLADIPRLITAYYEQRPDMAIQAQRVAFGTSGHRGSSLQCTFNEMHILAITRAICLFRQKQATDGPLFMGFDTHALSQPAFATALEVLAAHGVTVMIADGDDYTPTPAISHAIVAYNYGRKTGLADGIVITPSHNPPEDGGFKYNPPHGGPAGTQATAWIQARANEILSVGEEVRRLPLARALKAGSTKRHDFLRAYIGDLVNVVDMDAIRGSGLRLAADALGGAGIHYWPRLAGLYGIDLKVLHGVADPTFRFMSYDWDGRIRMDPSSPDAMQGLIALKDEYDLAFACDTDHDRHGIVTKGQGLMPPNQYLAVAVDYLVTHRPDWKQDTAIGKTIVSSGMIDRAARRNGRKIYETPVGFKWFVEGLTHRTLCFAGEESAGATFPRMNGDVWTTDKDGIIAALLSAEITARTGKDPAQLYAALTDEVGPSFYQRSDAPASQAQRDALGRVTPQAMALSHLAGEPVGQVLTHAPGDGDPIGGIKVIADGGWFAARPSGTEDVYKIYAESFHSEAHLAMIVEEAQAAVAKIIVPQSGRPDAQAHSR